MNVDNKNRNAKRVDCIKRIAIATKLCLADIVFYFSLPLSSSVDDVDSLLCSLFPSLLRDIP